MMANNWQRLNIWLGMANRFDYNEYVTACETAGVVPHGPLEFAQKAGMVSAGIAQYPERPVSEAYLLFLNQGSHSAQPMVQQSAPVTGCNGCGGGAVL